MLFGTFSIPLLFPLIGLTLRSDAHSELLTSRQITSDKIIHCDADSEQTVNQCLQPILDYANAIQRETSTSEHFSLKGGDVFKQLCRFYAQFRVCTKEVSCTSVAVRAVDASYGYMCGKGYDLFEEHASCFAEVENQPEYVRCKRTASGALDEALKLKSAGEYGVGGGYFQRLCDVMDVYLRCCRPLVNRGCGAKAWGLVSRITTDSLGVTMPDCNVERSL